MKYLVFALLLISTFAEFQDVILQEHNKVRAAFNNQDTPQKAGYTNSFANPDSYPNSSKKWSKPTVAIPQLTWSSTAANLAQGWANKCQWGHNPSRTVDGKYHGENIYASSTYYSDAKAVQAVAGWYQELYLEGCIDPTNKNYQNSACSNAHVGHFTQVVWSRTTSVGCAYKDCPNGLLNWSAGHVIIVCNYYPGGNYSNSYVYQ